MKQKKAKAKSKMAQSKYSKKLKDFPDYKKFSIADAENKKLPFDPETEITAGIEPIISNPKLEDLVKRHVLYNAPLKAEVNTKLSKKKYDDPEYTAQLFKNIVSKLLARKLAAKNISQSEIIPSATEKIVLSQLPEKEVTRGTAGRYTPSTGKIQLDFDRPDEAIYKTYAHELAHKAEGQTTGIEGKKITNVPAQVLLLKAREQVENPLPGETGSMANKVPVPANELMNYYYGKHHRPDYTTLWETEAYRNLEAGKPIRQPITRELSPEYLTKLKKMMEKKK
jgi:hypothetical protein